jgi:hypothetical protein
LGSFRKNSPVLIASALAASEVARLVATVLVDELELAIVKLGAASSPSERIRTFSVCVAS